MHRWLACGLYSLSLISERSRIEIRAEVKSVDNTSLKGKGVDVANSIITVTYELSIELSVQMDASDGWKAKDYLASSFRDLGLKPLCYQYICIKFESF